MKDKSITVLRWIGILPVACIVYVLGYALLILLNWISTRMFFDSDGDGGWMTLYVWPVIASGCAGFYFVEAGKALAPSNKKTVSFILMMIMALFSGAVLMGVVVTRNYTIIFAAIAQSIGACVGYFNDESI